MQHRSQLGHDPGPRVGQRRLLGHRDRPSSTGSVLAARRDGIPRRVKAAYLTDEEIIYLADWAAQARATHHAGDRSDDAAKVVRLLRKDDAA